MEKHLHMINNQTLDNERILQGLRLLNDKYSKYLEDEGKWLDGGFETIVTIDASHSDPDYSPLIVKKEIYMMLPNDIREDIQRLIEVE